MPSPFPGMNPYLEHRFFWEDFHDRFLIYAAEEIGRQTLPAYFVRVAEHVFVTDPDGGDGGQAWHADIALAEVSEDARAGEPVRMTAPAAVAVPEFEKERLIYLEVVDRLDRRVVTVLELLSPANKKPGKDRRQYEDKWRSLLAGATNYVEIDLLRGWPRMPWVGLPACDYCVAVSRPADRPRVEFWPVRLRDPLPPIPIPLRDGEPEPTLDLQAVLHRVYDVAGYQYQVYAHRPQPPLSADDAAWAAGFVPRPAGG